MPIPQEHAGKLIKEIQQLKKRKKAIILVHNYQRPEIYKIADFIGDSFGLSKKAAETKAKIIVFCGVDFMAESAAILNPDKLVLFPVLAARCPMAAMCNAGQVRELKARYPKAAVVAYINTSAEVKAVSDICCTSSNAIEVVNSLPDKEVIFLPDKNLAHYVSLQTDKRIIPFNGFCYVHHQFKSEDVIRAKKSHPKAEVIAHPECPPEVIEIADKVGSTNQMLKYVKESRGKEFVILTEMGMLERLKQEVPEKKFYSAPARACLQMKKNRLELVRDALLYEKYRVIVPEEIRIKAKRALAKMLNRSAS